MEWEKWAFEATPREDDGIIDGGTVLSHHVDETYLLTVNRHEN
jgi:hypothetical protein